MPLSTQHWIGIGGAAALLGYLLWPKKAHAAAPIAPPTPTPTPPAPYTPPSPITPYTAPPAVVPYGTPTPGYVASKDFDDGLSYGKTVGAKYGASDRDSGADPIPLEVKEEPGGSDDYTAGFRVGYVAGYNGAYYTASPKTTAPAYAPSAVKDTAGAQRDGYKAGYAAGHSDPSPFPLPTFVAPAGYRDNPSDSELSAFWVAGFTDGYSVGFTAGHDSETGALISGAFAGQGLARGHILRGGAYMPGHWSAFMPRTTPAHYGMWTPAALPAGMAGVGWTSRGRPVGVGANAGMVDFSGRPMKHPYR